LPEFESDTNSENAISRQIKRGHTCASFTLQTEERRWSSRISRVDSGENLIEGGPLPGVEAGLVLLSVVASPITGPVGVRVVGDIVGCRLHVQVSFHELLVVEEWTFETIGTAVGVPLPKYVFEVLIGTFGLLLRGLVGSARGELVEKVIEESLPFGWNTMHECIDEESPECPASQSLSCSLLYRADPDIVVLQQSPSYFRVVVATLRVLREEGVRIAIHIDVGCVVS